MRPVIITILISLFAALIAGVFGRSQKHNRVEEKLTEMASANAKAVLEEARFKDVGLEYDHLTGMLTGTVSSADDKAAIKSLLEANVGAGRINNEQIQIVVPKIPVLVDAVRNGKLIVLKGEVATPDVRAAIQKAVETEGVTVKNEMTIGENTASIVPKAPLFAALRGVLSGSKNSFVRLNGDELTVSGQLVRPAKKSAILDEMGTVEGATLVHDELIDPPALPAALKLVNKNNRIEVSGLVPTEADRDIIISSAKSAAPEGKEVIDQLVVQSDVKNPAWLAGSAVLVGNLIKGVEGGGLEIGPGKFEVSGMAKSPEIAKSLATGFSNLKTGSDFTNGITVPAPKIPSIVKISSEGKGFNLSGTVPDQATRGALMKSFSDGEVGPKVTDNLTISPNAVRAGWLAILPGFVKEFYSGDTKRQGLEVGKGKMLLKGEMVSAEAKTKLLASAEPIRKAGIEVVDQLTIAKPAPKPEPKPQIPASLSATMNGKTLNLTGNVPKKADRDAIVKAANDLPSKPKVNDNIKIGNNTKPADWSGEFPKLLKGFFANDAAQSLSVQSDGKLILKGEMPSKKVKADVLAGAAAIKKSGVEVVDQLTVAPVKMAAVVPQPKPKVEPKPAEKPKMAKPKPTEKPKVEVKQKPIPQAKEAPKKVAVEEKAVAEIKPVPNADQVSIYFNTNSSLLRESQVSPFFKAMNLAKAEGAKITLFGYADKRGTSEYNKELSSRRNAKIKTLMIKHGISPDQIRTVAMGEADGGQSFKQSRRVEIHISK